MQLIKKQIESCTDKVQAEQDPNDCDTECCLSIENEVVQTDLIRGGEIEGFMIKLTEQIKNGGLSKPLRFKSQNGQVTRFSNQSDKHQTYDQY